MTRSDRWGPNALVGVIAIATTAVAGALARNLSTGSAALAVLLIGALYGLLAVGNLRRVCLAVIVVNLSLQWGTQLGFNLALANKGSETGWSLSVSSAALLVLYALWVSGNTESHLRSGVTAARPLMVYVALCALSVFSATSQLLAVQHLTLLIESLLLFIYIAGTGRRDLGLLLDLLAVAVLVEGLLIVVLSVTGIRFHFLGLRTDVISTPTDALNARRFGGTLGSPNTAAAFFATTIPILVAARLRTGSDRSRLLALAAVLVGVPAVVITGSRAGWIAVVISLLIIAVFSVTRGAVRLRAVVVAALAVLLLAFPLASLVAGRLTEDDNGSASSRVAMARLAVKMIDSRPLTGVGLNNVAYRTVDFAGPDFTGEFLYSVHDKYLLVAAEAGIPALLAFLWFLLATLRRCMVAMKSTDLDVAMLGCGLLAALCGQLVQMSTDIFSSRAQVQLLWFVGALAVVVRRASDQPVTATPRRTSRCSPNSQHARTYTSVPPTSPSARPPARATQ